MVEINSFEDFKIIISFKDANGKQLNSDTMKFKFIYKDQSGKSYEVSYDGAQRVNNIVRDGVLFAIFKSGAFRNGNLSASRMFWEIDNDFPDGRWNFGGVAKTNIYIK